MFKLNNTVLAKSFYWFGLICGIFAVTTQMAERTIFASPFFYLELGILSMLAGVVLTIEKR
ncbi:MAG: hypothetical protein V1719_00440 [Patescibacteria group bacterium]